MAADESYPDDLRYHAAHDWVRVDGDEARLRHHLVRPGRARRRRVLRAAGGRCQITADAPYGELESVKAVSDVIAPLAGEVVAVNEAVVESPELVNQDPYGEGWLIRVRLDDPASANGLMDADAYRAHLQTL